MLLVDTTNPTSPAITPLTVANAPNNLYVQGNFLYAPSAAAGLVIYKIPGNKLDSSITSYTATVQAANNAAIAYDANSFNVAPSKITAGSGFDTLEWDSPNVSTLTWNSKVTALLPGQISTIDQGGTVSFTFSLVNGSVNLAAVDINAEQIVSLSPASQTITAPIPFQPPTYNVIVRNPTNSAITYNLGISGVPT